MDVSLSVCRGLLISDRVRGLLAVSVAELLAEKREAEVHIRVSNMLLCATQCYAYAIRQPCAFRHTRLA